LPVASSVSAYHSCTSVELAPGLREKRQTDRNHWLGSLDLFGSALSLEVLVLNVLFLQRVVRNGISRRYDTALADEILRLDFFTIEGELSLDSGWSLAVLRPKVQSTC